MTTTGNSSRRSRKAPIVLLDRCIPDTVGAALKHFDISFTTLAREYGTDEAQHVQDVDWIRDVGMQGWIALTQNFRIARVPHESAAVREHLSLIHI